MPRTAKILPSSLSSFGELQFSKPFTVRHYITLLKLVLLVFSSAGRTHAASIRALCVHHYRSAGPLMDAMSGNPRAMEGADRNQGMIIVVASPNIGPGDWKSAAQSDPLPAPPVKPQPAPSRAMNSRS